MLSISRVTSAGLLLGLMAGCDGFVPLSATGPVQSSVLDGVVNAIGTIVASDPSSALGPLGPGEREQLTALYGRVGDTPLWVDASGRPSRNARDALALLGGAADEGLDPDDYGGAVLERLAATLEAPHPSAWDVAAFDIGLSASTLRYLRELHEGRVDPRALGLRVTAPPDHHDFAGILSAALDHQRINETAAELSPSLALYRDLRRMLARYRALETDPTPGELPRPGKTVHPGEPYTGAGALQRRLVALGDLPGDAPFPGEASVYEGGVVEGVKHFQIRHGLQADGVLGAGTQTALGIPLDRRVRQIELALERLRWLPHLGGERFLVVNIPMFHLWGWDRIPPDGAPSFGTGVIVGRALNTQTPVFIEEMSYIIFRPYWNVPSSILRHEILPALTRDPDYLERHEMEIVAGAGDNAGPVAVSAESVARLRQGALRVRQRPGPGNSLGLVKFVFPNDDNVYMHGTPAPKLFSRPRRDFSHGCIRVEDPVALAEWVFKEDPVWTRDRILAAMNANKPHRVNLTRPIQVILFYMTALVVPEDGTIRFADDIYGHDAKLDRALAGRQLSQGPD